MLEICESVNESFDCDGLKTEFVADVISCNLNTSIASQTESELIYKTIEEIQDRIDELNSDIDKLTNHADGIDYMVAVASGVICGLIDVLFVSDLSFEKANEWGNEKVNDFVMKIAKKQGYEGDDLSKAVEFLEDKYPIAADKATNAFGGGLQHHLRDFSHHPTPVGLIFSLLTQFTKKVYGTDTAGFFKIYPLNPEDFVLIGRNLHEKLLFGVVHWFFHMVSDMAGSSSSIQNGSFGTGLPGPLVSLLKELSSLPFFKKLNKDGYKEFSVWISKLFNGTLLGERNENGRLIPVKFDLRTEIGLLPQLGKQAIPVIINECVVRGFYFARRLSQELKKNNVQAISDLERIDWKSTLPFNNRTIVRMLTISLGTFVTIDLADAAIESAIKSGGFAPGFAKNMIVKVNFVGIGRFTIAVFSDVKMGIKRNQKVKEVIVLLNEQIGCYNATSANALKSLLESLDSSNASITAACAEIQRNQSVASDNIAKANSLLEQNQNDLEELL